ncbi:MAG: hypothetical protein ABSF10_01315 [Verrucomicrobiota bacterium]
MKERGGNFSTDFVLVLVLVLETSPEKSDYENEDDDEDDPASVFAAVWFLHQESAIEDPSARRGQRPGFRLAAGR